LQKIKQQQSKDQVYKLVAK